MLRIGNSGSIELRLDKDQWQWGDPSESIANLQTRRFTIVGQLEDTGRWVRLEQAFAKNCHPFGPRGCAVTVIGAFICVVHQARRADRPAMASVGSIRFPLGSLRAWLNLPMPATQTTETGFSVHYAAEPDLEFRLDIGRLTVATSTNATADLEERTLTATQSASIELALDGGVSFEKARELYFDLEDLFVLLTDQEIALEWPTVELLELKSSGTLYCTRRPRKTAKFSAIECWILFTEIRDSFGSIVDRWLSLRDEFGPAFHLYLGTRRGVDLYEEHQFVNLIWGLESLHRQTMAGEVSENATAKVNRILASVDSILSKKDKKMLTKCLNLAVEPSLADRLTSIIAQLPLRVSKEAAINFATKCAKRRNEISHLGGPNQRVKYSEFVLDLHRLAGALSHIYHAAILLKLGVGREQIERIFFVSFGSFFIRSRLAEAGLLPDAQPQPIPPVHD